MHESDIIVGLDIGTTKVAACAGRIHEGGIEVVAVHESPNSGVRKGMITDINDTVNAISATLEGLERELDAPVAGVVAGIGGVEIASTESKGVVAVARPDSEITEEDVARALDAAQSITLPPNREVLHSLAKYFTTDHDPAIPNPVGTKSIRLEVSSHLITVSSMALRNLEGAVTQSGLQLTDIVFNPLATAKAVLSKRQMESGVMLLDFGAATTDFVIYEEGQLVQAGVIPIGSQHITNDIAIGVRTNLELAEILKKECGTALPAEVKASEIIRMSEFDPDDRETIKRQYLGEIIEARLGELFKRVNDELKALDCNGRLPAGVVLVGNGARLDGLVDYVKEILKLPATLAHPRLELPTKVVDTKDIPDYTTSVGLLLWGLDQGHSTPEKRLSVPSLPQMNVDGVLSRAKDLFKQFLP